MVENNKSGNCDRVLGRGDGILIEYSVMAYMISDV